MRSVAAGLVVVLLGACVLRPPRHRAALVVNAAAASVGVGLIAYNVWDCRDAGPDGCHLHTFAPAPVAGVALVLGAVVGAIITAALAQQPSAPARARR